MSRAATVARVVCAGALAASACSADAVRSEGAFQTARADALARGRVFVGPFSPARLAPGATTEAEVACRFLPTPATGTTPKFDCELPDGTVVKVKYGDTPEIPGEAAASRLLGALGFGADRVTLAARVRCYGCPESPFYTRGLARWRPIKALLHRTRDYEAYREFQWAAVEYKLPGVPLESAAVQGWSFFELDQVDSRRGGAPPEDVDALRLMAIFLAHWDNKSANQRLVCLPPNETESCARPLLMLQDVGATFGPRKVDLDGWRRTSVWTDADRCVVSMKGLPHGGATFVDVQISEAGRRVLAERLTRLSPPQIETLFADARFPGAMGEWVATFQQKVREVAARPPCPGPSTALH